MTDAPLTTARAARLLGVALGLYAVLEFVTTEAFNYYSRAFVLQAMIIQGVGPTQPNWGTFLIADARSALPVLATGLLLIVMSRRLERWLR